MKYLIGVFCILHGLVHLLYMGHSLNLFELEKGFIWPDNSKFLSNIMNRYSIKRIAAGLCVMAAVTFVVSGIYLFTDHPRGKLAILIPAITSTVLFISFWDGSKRKLHTQGGIALIINILILVYALL